MLRLLSHPFTMLTTAQIFTGTDLRLSPTYPTEHPSAFAETAGPVDADMHIHLPRPTRRGRTTVSMPDAFWRILRDCLHPDPTLRPTAVWMLRTFQQRANLEKAQLVRPGFMREVYTCLYLE